MMSDYTTGSMFLSTDSKYLNEAILTCILVTGMFCVSYGALLVASLFNLKADEYEHEDEQVETP